MFGYNAIGKNLLAVAAAFALSLSSTLIAVGPIAGATPDSQIAAGFDRDGSPAHRTERA